MPSLEEYTGPLDKRLRKHLLRRACFQYSKEQLDGLEGKTAAEIFSTLTVSKTYTWEWPYDPITSNNQYGSNRLDGSWLEDPDWTYVKYINRQTPKRSLVTAWWWYNALKQNTVIDKLTWFLFTTFTVSKDEGAGRAGNYFDYLNLLQFYADKSVKTLARKISFDNSMLFYLDNTDNEKESPNENYAREFLELFTIGKGEQVAEGDYTNYTEHDVVQAARVFSGIKHNRDRDVYDSDTVKQPHYPYGISKGWINTNKHDPGNKTFSYAFNGQTISGGSNQSAIERELDDFVDMVFDKIATAKNYVRKLYRMYVRSEWGQDVEDDIITPLAQQLQSNGYNLLGVLRTLLISKHFFDLDDDNATNENIGGIIKNPMQYLNELITLLGVSIPDATATPPVLGQDLNNSVEYYNFYRFWHWFCHSTLFPVCGMDFFAPNTVAGYPGDYQPPAYDRAWFNSNNIIGRYNIINSFIGKSYNDNYGNGVNQIKGIQTANNGSSYYQRIWTSFNVLSFFDQNISDPFSAQTIIEELADLLYSEPIDEDRKAYFKLFLVPLGEPDYYWWEAWNDWVTNGNSTQVKLRLDDLLSKMINAAEFQLM